MNKLHFTALGAALLSGCAGQSGSTGNTAVAALESTYVAAATAALVYEALPSADPAVVAMIKRDEGIAFAALQPLVAAAQAGASLDSAMLAAAQAALATLQADMPATPAPAAAASAAASAPAGVK